MVKAFRLSLGSAWRAAPAEVCVLGILRVLAGAVPAVTTLLLSILFSEASEHRVRIGIVAGLLVGLLAGAVIPPASQYVVLQISRACGVSSRTMLYEVLARFPTLEAIEGPSSQDRIRLAIDAAAQSPILTVDGGMALVQGVVSVTSIFALIVTRSPAAAVTVTVLAVPMTMLRMRVADQRTRARTAATPYERRSMFYEQLLTNLDYAKELRTLALFTLFRSRMVHQLREAQKPIRRADRLEMWIHVITGVLGAGVVGIAVISARNSSVEVITILVVGIPQFLGQLEATLNSASSIRSALQLFTSYLDLLGRAESVTQPAPRDLPPLEHGISFSGVWFRYPDATEWALRGVDLDIPAGCSTGIVGRNGAGKSTIAALLCGLYRPAAGKILWDGEDIAEIDPQKLRARINIAFQRPTHYEMTVAENIWLGDIAKPATPAHIAECLDRVSLSDRIAVMPRAADTMLSKAFSPEADSEAAGSLLSGGEWQRLVLARLHFRWPRDVTILDEPTANLDPISERNAHDAMRTLLRGKTAVLIAHRLQLVSDSDQIIVLHEGQVVQQGRHPELMAQDGLYKQMCEAQLAPVLDVD